METGWMYLHQNGDLIYKRDLGDGPPGSEGSDFVKNTWPIDPSNRLTAWNVIIESLTMGANLNRVRELAGKWHCTGEDLPEYLVRAEPTPARFEGVKAFLRDVLSVDSEAWFDWLEATSKGEKPDFTTMPRPAQGEEATNVTHQD